MQTAETAYQDRWKALAKDLADACAPLKDHDGDLRIEFLVFGNFLRTMRMCLSCGEGEDPWLGIVCGLRGGLIPVEFPGWLTPQMVIDDLHSQLIAMGEEYRKKARRKRELADRLTWVEEDLEPIKEAVKEVWGKSECGSDG